jgi:DNA-binding LytR/AlgR family response regulator
MQAENAQHALNCLQKDNVDLLFVDIEMPGMSGLQLLESLQHEGGSKPPYSFIITAFRKYEFALKGFRLGILDYIEKPLHSEKIYNAVKLYLDRIKSETIELKVYDGYSRIQISQLLASKATSRRKIMIYTSDAILPEVACSLRELHEQLPANFRYIKRNCVVNIHEVKHYNLKTRELVFISQGNPYPFTVSRNNMKDIVALLNDTLRRDG